MCRLIASTLDATESSSGRTSRYSASLSPTCNALPLGRYHVKNGERQYSASDAFAIACVRCGAGCSRRWLCHAGVSITHAADSACAPLVRNWLWNVFGRADGGPVPPVPRGGGPAEPARDAAALHVDAPSPASALSVQGSPPPPPPPPLPPLLQ
eukprot:366314-Chlamydomonas_euryale.AAC.4